MLQDIILLDCCQGFEDANIKFNSIHAKLIMIGENLTFDYMQNKICPGVMHEHDDTN